MGGLLSKGEETTPSSESFSSSFSASSSSSTATESTGSGPTGFNAGHWEPAPRGRPVDLCVVGIDYGTERIRVSVHHSTDPAGVPQIVRWDSGSMEVPSVVSMKGKERLFFEHAQLGTDGTLAGMKRLLGATHDAAVAELARFHPALAQNSSSSSDLEPAAAARPTFKVSVGSTLYDVIPEQVVGMLFEKISGGLAKLPRKPQGIAVAVPPSASSAMRRAILDAGEIAGMPQLMLVDSDISLALCYAFRRELPIYSEAPALRVLFVDIGNSFASFALTSITSGGIAVLSRASSDEIGAREVDQAIFEEMMKIFTAKHGEKQASALRSNVRARSRLLRECEKAKTILSANSETEIRVEAILGDLDFSAPLSRAQLEGLPGVMHLIENLKTCIDQLSLQSKEATTTPDTSSRLIVELVGGGVRIPVLRKTIQALVPDCDLSFTLDSSSSVAVGAALYGAILTNQIPFVVDFNSISSHSKRNKSEQDDTSKKNNNANAAGGKKGKKQKQNNNNEEKPTTSQTTHANTADEPVGLGAARINECIAANQQMAVADEQIKATRDKKNELESLVYSGKSQTKNANAIKQLEAIEAWLYAEGEDTTLDVYEEKLNEVKKLVSKK